MRYLLALPIALLMVFFALPTANSFVSYLRWSSLVDTITSASNISLLWFTVWQAVLSTCLTMFVALPATWALSRYTYMGSQLLRGFITAPFMMPSVVVAAGVLAILPSNSRYGLHAILWAHVIFNVAVVVRTVGPQWAAIDQSSYNAAATLGANPIQTFTLVTWPRIRNSVMNSVSLVFVFCFTSFGVITILGGFTRRTIETEIFTQAIRLGNIDTAISLSLIQVLVVLLVLRVSRVSVSGLHYITSESTSLRTKPRYRSLVPAISVGATLVVLAPLCAVAFRSVYNNGFNLMGWKSLTNDSLSTFGIYPMKIFITSFLFAGVTILISIPCATVFSFARNSPVKASARMRLISSVSVLPIVISSVTLGLGLILTFQSDPFAWRSERWLIPVIHSVIAFPLALRILQPAVASLPHTLRNAASILGASPWRVWWYVDMRTIRPALLRAAGMSAAVSFGEFGATSFLSRSGSTTFPLAIASLLGRTGDSVQQSGFALATLMVVVTTVVMSRA